MQPINNNGIVSFIGSDKGKWNVLSMKTIIGEPLTMPSKIEVIKGDFDPLYFENNHWILRAFISNLRYTTKDEKTELTQNSMSLGRPEFNHGAFIPIKKSDAWWALAQDERRKIFEEDSQHIRTSAKFLSAISRQLHHSRDLGEAFDFLTWFEFSSEHDDQFDELCDILRKTEEWKYVTREIDIRLEQ